MQTTQTQNIEPSQKQGFLKTHDFDREKMREDLRSDSTIRGTRMYEIEDTKNENSQLLSYNNQCLKILEQKQVNKSLQRKIVQKPKAKKFKKVKPIFYIKRVKKAVSKIYFSNVRSHREDQFQKICNDIQDQVSLLERGLVPAIEKTTLHDNYDNETKNHRIQFYSFLCQDCINPREVILKGKYKAGRSHYRGITKQTGLYQVQFYLNSKKQYFYSFKEEVLAAQIYDILQIQNRCFDANINFDYCKHKLRAIMEMPSILSMKQAIMDSALENCQKPESKQKPDFKIKNYQNSDQNLFTGISKSSILNSQQTVPSYKRPLSLDEDVEEDLKRQKLGTSELFLQQKDSNSIDNGKIDFSNDQFISAKSATCVVTSAADYELQYVTNYLNKKDLLEQELQALNMKILENSQRLQIYKIQKDYDSLERQLLKK